MFSFKSTLIKYKITCLKETISERERKKRQIINELNLLTPPPWIYYSDPQSQFGEKGTICNWNASHHNFPFFKFGPDLSKFTISVGIEKN